MRSAGIRHSALSQSISAHSAHRNSSCGQTSKAEAGAPAWFAVHRRTPRASGGTPAVPFLPGRHDVSRPAAFRAPRRSGTGFRSARPVAMAYMKICPVTCIRRWAVSMLPFSSMTRSIERTSGAVMSAIGLLPELRAGCAVSRWTRLPLMCRGVHSCSRAFPATRERPLQTSSRF